MLNELEVKIQQAYVKGDLAYFRDKQFIQDMAALGWSLADLPSNIVAIKDADGKYSIEPIWPVLEAKFMKKIDIVDK